MNNLIPLDEYNRNFKSRISKNHTGLACPNCNSELQKDGRGLLLLTSPPQQRVICFNCNYKGSYYVD